MSLSSLLSIARSALLTHQRAIDVTGHNIANAATPGYRRQYLEIVESDPLRTPWGTIGRGVTDRGVFRARDVLIDGSFRRETGVRGEARAAHDMLSQVEAVLGEPSDAGLGATLDAFFSALSDLAVAPGNATTRSLVQQNAVKLSRQFNQLDGRLVAVADGAAEQLQQHVTTINSLVSQIAELNGEIVSAGGPTKTAPDLADRRDALIDRLSELGAVRVLDRDNGSVGVVFGDTLLVDAANFQTVETRGSGAGLVMGIVGGPLFNPGAGAVSALSTLTVTTLPGIRAQLDQLAGALVTQVNLVHRTGTTPGGVTGTDFFDPAGVTAGTIALAPAVAASPSAIAAGATSAPGDGAVALQLSLLRQAGVAGLGGATFGEFYTRGVAAVGTLVHAAADAGSAAEALVGHFEQARAATSGVSVDEEMVELVTRQNAFAAAARLVTVADEMIKDVLAMV